MISIAILFVSVIACIIVILFTGPFIRLMHSIFQDQVRKFFLPHRDSAVRQPFTALLVDFVQHLTALIAQAVMNLSVTYRAKADEIGVDIQTIGKTALQMNRDGMMRLHVRLMRALCHKGLMPSIHLAVIVSNRQGLFPQDIRPCPVLDLIAPRLFCTDRHRHIQFANIMTKGHQVRSFRKLHIMIDTRAIHLISLLILSDESGILK